MSYLSKVLNAPVPQTEQENKAQVQNSAGGFSFAVDRWKRLERFLILGSEGGSYYASERALTLENAKVVEECIAENSARTIDTILAVSMGGRAPRNSQALFALAMALAKADTGGKNCVATYLPHIARTGSHLFEFVSYASSMRGWGRTMRNAIANWYTSIPEAKLAYQVIKYRNRNNMTHADVLRQAHPKTDGVRNDIFKWIVDGWDVIGPDAPDNALVKIWAHEKAQRATQASELLPLILDYGLPRESIPTQFLDSVAVWDALLHQMPMTAMIRNLPKMTEIGLLAPLSGASRLVADRLRSAELLKGARVHPYNLLVAKKTYETGQGRNFNWRAVPQVTDALEDAFYLAFDTIPVTNKRWLLGIDVSGSMTWGGIAGGPVTPREGAAVMSMVTLRKEPQSYVYGFCHEFTPLDYSAKSDLAHVLKVTGRARMGGTDCALPMTHALKHKIPVDVFAVYTDSETYVGSIHPHKALEKYRQAMGIPAKLVVVGMVANNFSIANPADAGMLDVVGFDSSAPAVMSDFASDGAVSAQDTED